MTKIYYFSFLEVRSLTGIGRAAFLLEVLEKVCLLAFAKFESPTASLGSLVPSVLRVRSIASSDLSLYASSSTDCNDYIEPTQIIQGTFLISRFLIMLAKCLLPSKVTHSQILEISTWMYLGCYYWVYCRKCVWVIIYQQLLGKQNIYWISIICKILS